MEIKYLEWNLNARGGREYKIPEFVSSYIKSDEPDIFGLVEFCASEGWEEFEGKLNQEFDLYCSPFASNGYNQVCIGLKKSLNYELISVDTLDICNAELPELLQVNIKIGDKKLSVIVTRIKTQGNKKDSQYKYLQERLKKIDNFLCLGDFNCVHNTLSRLFSQDEYGVVFGPRVNNGYYSFVFNNRGKQGLDWLIAKGMCSVYNGYSDKEKSPYATYDWSFVTEENGYGEKGKDDYLGIVGLPDHAILKGMVKI